MPGEVENLVRGARQGGVPGDGVRRSQRDGRGWAPATTFRRDIAKMVTMGNLILLRHGETEWSRDGRHTGRTDIPLTTKGEASAAALAPALAKLNIVAVFTSPAQRAVRTAELAGVSGATTDPDLWEWDYGGYDGRTTKEIQAERPGWYLWRDGVIPETPIIRARPSRASASARTVCWPGSARSQPTGTWRWWLTRTSCGS